MTGEMDSDDPLMESVRKSIQDSNYVEILKYDCDTNRQVYVRDIQFAVDAVTNNPVFEIWINGEKKLRDFQPVTTTGSLGFSGHLIMTSRMKKPSLLIRAKNTGTAATIITVVVTGLKVPFNPKVGPPFGK